MPLAAARRYCCTSISDSISITSKMAEKKHTLTRSFFSHQTKGYRVSIWQNCSCQGLAFAVCLIKIEVAFYEAP